MEALFLDVDGVIINSIDECYLISSEVYFKEFKSKSPDPKTKELFYQYRGLVRPVYQYMVLFQAIESVQQGNESNIEKKFIELNQSSQVDNNNRFENLFFDLRKKYQADLASWIRMNPLTPFGQTLKEKHLPNTFFITTKDAVSVKHISRHYNIKVGDVFDKEVYSLTGSKGRIITNFLNEQNDYDSAIFIDDAIEHLDTVDDSRIKCYFAGWGYGNNRDYPEYTPDLWVKTIT
jgi:phosphoglycolate phosphatase-like HAD superfamily hydrolase